MLAVTTPQAALDQLEQNRFDLVLLDMNFQQDTTSGGEGLDLVETINRQDGAPPIIVMTGWATIDIAVKAMQLGAKDFIQKPWNNDRLLSAIDTQLKLASFGKQLERLSQENKLLSEQNQPATRDHIIAESPAMKDLLDNLADVASSDMSILLTGDNGTGKSMLAAYIHKLSHRRDHSFVPVNMGAIPETLFESEMFGHKKGAFTDAKDNRIGRFEMAEQGTLFLDELANIPITQQAKLLRVLEERKFEVVGSSKALDANVRILSATNCNLTEAIEQQTFRQDLFYRLNTVQLHVPSLAERQEDIVPLAEHFLLSFASKYHRDTPSLSDCAIHALQAYAWPGNIRELSHLMEKLLFTSKSSIIQAADLMLAPPQPVSTSATNSELATEQLTLDEIEQQALVSRLEFHQGNVSKTAKSLGLSRSGYYRRLSKYGLS